MHILALWCTFQGSNDKFLAAKQLQPESFRKACEAKGQPLVLRMQEGYDHSYDFIASFIRDHIQHHATALKAAALEQQAKLTAAASAVTPASSSNEGKTIECKAAVAWGPSVEQLKIETVSVAPPKVGSALSSAAC